MPNSSAQFHLSSQEQEASIKDSKEWVLKSSGWPTEEAALEAGQRYQNALSLALARLRIGADFGNRAPGGAFTVAGLQMLEEQTGRRVLNDAHGLMVYESDPPPLYARSGPVAALRGVSEENFVEVLTRTLQSAPAFTDREQLSLELFFASFFQRSADARFLLLVIAVEALLEPQPRPAEATGHVERLIELTQNSEVLSPQEKESILGSLRWLRQQSIGQAARQLIRNRLSLREYQDRKAPAFFTHCYQVRSRLVHGIAPVPTWGEVGSLAATLETFVSDLLTDNLLEPEP